MYLSNFATIVDVSNRGWLTTLKAFGVEWDLHNYTAFDGFDYSTAVTDHNVLVLKWHIREAVIEWRDAQAVSTAQGIPFYPSNSFRLVFSNVNYLEVAPRDFEMPSDEDKTLSSVSCIEADEDSKDYIASQAIPIHDPNREGVPFHIVFRFQAGQFIRIGAETAEFVLVDKVR